MSIAFQEAEIYCRMELRSYGLKDHSIVWQEWPHTLGEAWPSDKQIHLSFVCLRSPSLLTWVLRHEIAHILDWIERGGTFERNGRNNFHGKSWKKWCKKLNVRSDRLIDFKYLSHL